jgi:hypothetical protein
MHCQNAGRQWNFNSSNIAGLVWGWTVIHLTSLVNSTLHFNLAFSPDRRFSNPTHFGNADR